MGWDVIHGASRNKALEIAIGDLSSYKVLDKKLVRDGAWLLLEHPERGVEIAIVLLEPYPKGWGFKILGEIEHPFYFDCPAAFLDRAPVRNEDWREAVLGGA